MSISRFDVRSNFRELERMRREMNRLFEQMDRGSRLSVAGGYPAMNVWSNADGVVVSTELPGVSLDDLDIAVQGDMLTLRGTRKRPELGEGAVAHRQERGYGQFQRVFQLPYEVETNNVDATYENGVLRITLPRAESAKPKKIEVKQA